MSLIDKARAFAIERHGEQKRKYGEIPYWHHLQSVAEIVATVPHDEEMLAAVWLHDVLEDTDTTFGELVYHFGPNVADLVKELTDASRPQDGNRAARKALDRERLANASARAQTIKLADLIDNTASIVDGDKNFARVYLAEKEALLDVLKGGDRTLWLRAFRTLQEGQRALVQHALKEG